MLTLPRPPLGARPDLGHPLCRGLKLFSFLGYGTSAVNLAGPHLGVPTNAPLAITGVQGPAMRYTRASNMRTGFTPMGLATGGDVTAICCAKTAVAGAGTFNTLLGCWDETAGFKGWLLHSMDAGGVLGIRMIAGGGGGVLIGDLVPTGDTNYDDGNYHVFAGSYGVGSQTVRVYQDGRRRNQETKVGTYNVAAPAAEMGVGGQNLHSNLASTSDVAWVAVFDRQLTDQEIADWSSESWEMFSDTSILTTASVISGSRYSTTIVPRVPLRYQTSGQQGQQGGQDPEKIDPRLVRFSEIVSTILNGLIRSGGIYRTGVDEWELNFIPPEKAGTDARDGEIYYDTGLAVLAFKDLSGVVHALYSSSVSTAAGTYTPTLTIVANLDSATAFQCQYLQVGTVVTVSGKVTIDPTAAGAATRLGISLPVASNLSAAEDCSGVAFASGIAGQGAAILGDTTNDRAQLEFISSDVSSQAMHFQFQFEIL